MVKIIKIPLKRWYFLPFDNGDVARRLYNEYGPPQKPEASCIFQEVSPQICMHFLSPPSALAEIIYLTTVITYNVMLCCIY
jgi:hypothetical protein